jgi:hypothetical protein
MAGVKTKNKLAVIATKNNCTWNGIKLCTNTMFRNGFLTEIILKANRSPVSRQVYRMHKHGDREPVAWSPGPSERQTKTVQPWDEAASFWVLLQVLAKPSCRVSCVSIKDSNNSKIYWFWHTVIYIHQDSSLTNGGECDRYVALNNRYKSCTAMIRMDVSGDSARKFFNQWRHEAFSWIYNHTIARFTHCCDTKDCHKNTDM